MKSPAHYQDLRAIVSVVHKFESCEYSKTEFTHGLHLTVAAWYVWTSSPEEALQRMRASLLRFTKHHQVQGYHETITRFWMLLVGRAIAPGAGDCDFVGRVNALLERFGDKNAPFQHYSRQLLMSDRARTNWVEPDLKPIGENECNICNNFR